jgi:DNA-directed RNA polymerase
MSLVAGGAVPFTALAARVGQAVQAEISMMKLRYKDRRLWSKLAAGRTANIATVRRQARRVLEEADWPARVHVKVGGALIHILLQRTRLEIEPSGRLVYERDDPEASNIPVSQHTREVQNFFLSEQHPFFPNAKTRDAAQLDDRDRKVEERMRHLTEDGLLPPEVAEIASIPRERMDDADMDMVTTAMGEKARREWDAVAKREKLTVSAFKHVYSKQNAARVTGMIAAHPRLMELLSDSAVKYAHPTQFPMVVPPRPWVGPHTGGYLKQRTSVVRMTPGAKMQIDMLKIANCPLVYEAVSVMGQTPWRVNHFVLDTIKKVWESGGGQAEVPSRKDLPIPEPPSEDALIKLISDADRQVAMKRFRISHRHAMQSNADLHSLRCDMMLKLNVAEQFRNDILYFPHNMDFRGRVYPIPPHLNHMGADVCRGMLTFAHPKPLGERGFRWLKIHVSNLMGKDKISLDERAAYTESNLNEVLDSAARPLTGNGWWLKADSPWQALAACRELSAAIQLKDPTTYECALPVHQDGSCNGLQHYAALGRDASGGRAVNLVPTQEDKPQDVYTQVLKLVIARMEADAGGTPIATPGSAEVPKIDGVDPRKFPSLSAAYEALQKTNTEDIDARAGINASVRKMAAEFLRGHVDRKVVKQTVMTSVYGVTFIGARQQILNRLKEKYEGHPMPVDELENTLFLCASYLARTTLDSLGDLFASADAIKKWLSDVARLVAFAEQPMAWITPLGLPVVQPYRRERSMMVKTVLQDVIIADSNEQLPVSASRQRSAFPPNYVHSLDSTHMMLTALDCRKRGLTFTAVHDSFWTHACDVDVMSASLREQFIHLYSMPLLENFRASLVQRFPGVTMPELPPRGTLNLETVRDARYFFN